MKTENYPNLLQGKWREISLKDRLKGWEETCENCHPLTPIVCITNCKIWKLKNEIRKLYEKMKNPRFMTELLNTLKNKRRLQILKMLSKGQYSIAGIQQELKKLGYYHSQKTINEEYITPLIEAGLAEENRNRYHITLFGSQLNELIKDLQNVENILPPHSKCYEEIALGMLLNKPRVYEDFEDIIPAKSIPRVLKRLQKAKLIETVKENDYVFYFKTKRDSNNEKFSPTEKRVYGNIPADGISTRKLAEKAEISLRRTYKYLRRLKGKKLVFARKRPKSYALTDKGIQIALALEGVRNLTLEALAATANFARDDETRGFMPDTSHIAQERKHKILGKTSLHF